MPIEHVKPEDIEKRSFEIITEILGEKKLDEAYVHIVKRCIHTSADFDYADNMFFSDGVVDIITRAMREGCHIVTDTQMAMAGVNKTALRKFGGEVHCFIADADVSLEAQEKGVTRASVAVEKAMKLDKPVIFAVGNAPTALIKLHEVITGGLYTPRAIIAAPVGFVNVVESKELIMATDVPCIVARGRKGGSNIAAAICNAIIYKLNAVEDR